MAIVTNASSTWTFTDRNYQSVQTTVLQGIDFAKLYRLNAQGSGTRSLREQLEDRTLLSAQHLGPRAIKRREHHPPHLQDRCHSEAISQVGSTFDLAQVRLKTKSHC